mmetsp:Transcript_4578/g.12960  ORF Transcript_4578/g.12960 Transcript_4578/m.12960 type:complete len:258 (+) Transcript_4578:1355-2128(+)
MASFGPLTSLPPAAPVRCIPFAWRWRICIIFSKLCLPLIVPAKRLASFRSADGSFVIGLGVASSNVSPGPGRPRIFSMGRRPLVGRAEFFGDPDLSFASYSFFFMGIVEAASSALAPGFSASRLAAFFPAFMALGAFLATPIFSMARTTVGDTIPTDIGTAFLDSLFRSASAAAASSSLKRRRNSGGATTTPRASASTMSASHSLFLFRVPNAPKIHRLRRALVMDTFILRMSFTNPRPPPEPARTHDRMTTSTWRP